MFNFAPYSRTARRGGDTSEIYPLLAVWDRLSTTSLWLLTTLAAKLYYDYMPGCWLWNPNGKSANDGWYLWCVTIMPTATLYWSNILGSRFYRLKVCRKPPPLAALNEPLLQVFSYFSRLTSYAHTAVKWIGRELLPFLPTISEVLNTCHSELLCLHVTLLLTFSSFLVCAC
jgi:hypothetical protein